MAIHPWLNSPQDTGAGWNHAPLYLAGLDDRSGTSLSITLQLFDTTLGQPMTVRRTSNRPHLPQYGHQ